MKSLLSFVKAGAVAAALALLPVASQAVTIDPATNIAVGGTYDMADGPFFLGAQFDETDSGGTVFFNFTSTVDIKAIATLAAFQSVFGKFDGGITVSWSGGPSNFVPESESAFGFSLEKFIAAGTTETLTITYGDPVSGSVSGDFAEALLFVDAAPIPLPAGGLLLISGLAGAAAIARRRKA